MLEDDVDNILLSAVLDAEDIDIMDDPSQHHLGLKIDVSIDNYDSDEEPLAVVRRRLLDSREESSRNEAILPGQTRGLRLYLQAKAYRSGLVPVDVDCLLSAVIAQVPELNLDTAKLRQCLCEHVTANSEDNSLFLRGGSCALLAHIELLKKRGQWNSNLGDLVPFAMANFLQRNILIFSSEETSRITPISPILTGAQGKIVAIT